MQKCCAVNLKNNMENIIFKSAKFKIYVFEIVINFR